MIEGGLVGDVHAYVLHPNDIERRVGIGQIEGVADVQRDGIIQADSLIEQSARIHIALRDVDAGHMTAVLDRQRARRSADSAANVEDVSPRTKIRELGEVTCGGSAANVEVLERGKVAGREVVDVFSGCGQRFQERITKLRSAVVGGP